MEIHVTALDADILRALATFTYCTIPQIARVVGVKNEKSVQNALLRMRSVRPLVHKHEYAFNAGVGRLHSVFTLAPAGVAVLAEILRCDHESIYYPAMGVQYSRDYAHRRNFIDAHIAIESWATTHEAEIEFFDRYFRAEGGNHSANPTGTDSLVRREYQTRVVLAATRELIIPDGIFAFTQNGASRLCALEIHQGRETKKIIAQLETHIRTIEASAIRKKYGREDANFVLSVYEHPETMQAVMKRFASLPNYREIRLAFHFTAIDDVRSDLMRAWRLASGEAVSLFRGASKVKPFTFSQMSIHKIDSRGH
jgi:hypothetical protein